jgi:hypothetical protein
MLLFEDSEYTRSHDIPEPQRKNPEHIIKPASKFGNLKTLN